MSHLSAERIAALVDESPTAAELAHLATCADCTHERGRYASVAELARLAPAINVPLTSWERLAPALRANGLIGGARPVAAAKPRRNRRWMQAAAGVLLVLGGMMGGRVTAGASAVPGLAGRDSVPVFRSVAAAERARNEAQRVSRAASMYLANADPSYRVTPRGLSERANSLAALNATIAALNEETREGQRDPVLSGIRQTTLAEYQATVQQMNTVRPASLTTTAW